MGPTPSQKQSEELNLVAKPETRQLRGEIRRRTPSIFCRVSFFLYQAALPPISCPHLSVAMPSELLVSPWSRWGRRRPANRGSSALLKRRQQALVQRLSFCRRPGCFAADD